MPLTVLVSYPPGTECKQEVCKREDGRLIVLVFDPQSSTLQTAGVALVFSQYGD